MSRKGVGDRRLEEKHLPEVPHLTPPASPFQLKAHPRAGSIIASAAQTVEGKRASDHKKPTCSPDEHFTLWFLLHPPSAQGKQLLQTRILLGTLSCTTSHSYFQICISNIFYLHLKKHICSQTGPHLHVDNECLLSLSSESSQRGFRAVSKAGSLFFVELNIRTEG